MCLATCSGGWTVQHEMTALRVLYIQGSSPKFPLCPSRPITSGDPGCVITHALLKGATPTSLSSFTSQCLVTKAVSSDMHFWRSKGATPTSLSSFTSQCLVTKAVSSDMHFWRSKGATPTSLSSFTSQCLVTKAVLSHMHFWRSKGATPTSLSSFTLQCLVTKAVSSDMTCISEDPRVQPQHPCPLSLCSVRWPRLRHHTGLGNLRKNPPFWLTIKSGHQACLFRQGL